MLEAHPIAEIFPMMSSAELDGLCEDIRENGLLDPVVLFEGKVLDGRNRQLACERVGVPLRTVEWAGNNPWTYVWSKNAERRHLEPGQKGGLALKKQKGSEAWDERLRAEREAANRARSEAAKARPRNDDGTLATSPASADAALEPKPTGPKHAAKAIAEDAGCSKATAERVITLEKKAPDLFEKVCSGEVKVAAAARELKRREATENLKSYSMPTDEDGPFGVIVADPPWKYDLREKDGSHRAANPYPSMSLEQIKGITIPAADDAILWLWTTNAHMEHAFDVCRAWGFEPKTVLTWVKTRMGLGDWLRGQTEHCILSARGKPVVTLTNQTTALMAAPADHSSKPDEFYELVETLCPDLRRLELFSRRTRDGWFCSGSDVE